MVVQEAVSDEEVVGLVAGARHGGDDVGAQEEVWEEGAEEDPHARARRRDRVARQPAPQAADEDRRLDTDEEREPDPQHRPPIAVHADDRERDQDGEHQGQADLIGEDVSSQRAPRIPSRQQRVGEREQHMRGRRPEREQPGPRVRIRPVPLEASPEGPGLVARPPPDVPEDHADRRGR